MSNPNLIAPQGWLTPPPSDEVFPDATSTTSINQNFTLVGEWINPEPAPAALEWELAMQWADDVFGERL